MAVLPGDRLVMVNGKQGVEAMSRELRTTKIVLCFERWLDKKGSCKVDLEFETSTNGTGKAETNGAGNSAEEAKAALRRQADLLREHLDIVDVQDGWDVDPEFDVPTAAETSAGAERPVGAAAAFVESAAADSTVEEHQTKQPEDAGWDVGLEFDATLAAEDDAPQVPAACRDISSDSKPAAHLQCPISSQAEEPSCADDGWDFDFDAALHSPAPPLPVEKSASFVSGTHSATPAPQDAVAAAFTHSNGTAAASSAAVTKTDKAFLMAAPGKPSSDIAQWPVVDAEGCWLQPSGLCVLAAAAGSQGYFRSLEALCASFGEPEYRVRFFCERHLPQGSLLLVLPSCSRCLLVRPERMHSAGSLLWRVLGGEVQALADSFDTNNFAACLARCRAA